jgi:tRNA1Val (adenine37-N6)-methyltransferase
MKVGTDGVLLGAWCSGEHAKNVLDIGTGTGLIALMLAQRFPHLEIQAIEPNMEAFLDAQTNIGNSPWGDRIALLNATIEDFTPFKSFDLIVSNPPFFHDALQAPESGRNMARHAIGFDFNALLNTHKWLSNQGLIAGIYPIEIFDKMKNAASEMGLHLHAACFVKPTPEKLAHRVLFSFGKHPTFSESISELVIESDGRHQFSDEYKRLTSAFYLKF